jgi:hypothetical protein
LVSLNKAPTAKAVTVAPTVAYNPANAVRAPVSVSIKKTTVKNEYEDDDGTLVVQSGAVKYAGDLVPLNPEELTVEVRIFFSSFSFLFFVLTSSFFN